MLVSWVVGVQPTGAVTVAANQGRAVHAWFLEQVGRVDAGLAEELHAGQTQRPFTVSNLLGYGKRRGDEVTLLPEKSYALRFTSFAPALSTLVQQRLAPEPPASLTLGSATLQVVSNTTDHNAHPWAGTDSFEDLVQRHTLGGRVSRGVGLRFASPTLFRSNDMNVPLPLPGLVFGGLLDKWNAFAPLQLHPDARRFAEDCLAVSRYRLETRRVAFGGRRAVAGCVGECFYAIQSSDRYWTGVIHLLAAFAFYAGAGRQTTMGLGQCKGLGIGD
jgi:CRISPR-associated endoribonuclease Cas6